FYTRRSRHMTSKRDWSSDVCSSDLQKSTVASAVVSWSLEPVLDGSVFCAPNCASMPPNLPQVFCDKLHQVFAARTVQIGDLGTAGKSIRQNLTVGRVVDFVEDAVFRDFH